MALNRKERVIRLVGAMGYTEGQSRSRHYRKFEKEGKPCIWVGTRGALRSGDTLKTSISLTHHLDVLLKYYHI